MSTISSTALSAFARDVADGLSDPIRKRIPAQYFYDDLGSALFEAITLLPEYGLSRADERLLQTHASQIASIVGPVATVAELGSGSGKKTRAILQGLRQRGAAFVYRPIDVSAAALSFCHKQLRDVTGVYPVCADWIDGLQQIAGKRSAGPLLLLFLGSSIGNLKRAELPAFLSGLRSTLQPGDFFLLGADLVKDVEVMLAAYDDPVGVTAAFNLNLLSRMNRELDADFDLRSFAHEVRWDSEHRRIEMHLLSGRDQVVSVGALDMQFRFAAGETIWTESSHKFEPDELLSLAKASGFTPVSMWTDSDWPFAEALWEVGG